MILIDELLADSLPLLSEWLGVKDIFRIGAASRELRETFLSGGDELLHRSIRAEVGHTVLGPTWALRQEDRTAIARPRWGLTADDRAAIARRKGLCQGCGLKTHIVSDFGRKAPITNQNVYKGVCIRCHPNQVPPYVLEEYENRNTSIHAPLSLFMAARPRQQPPPKALLAVGVPLFCLSEKDGERWIGYPSRATFHEMMAKEGAEQGFPTVESLTVGRIREMGMAVAAFKHKLLGSPEQEAKELVDWAHWHSPTFVGLRGGHCDLKFKEVCGIVVVFSLRIQKEFKNQYEYEFFHGYVNEKQELRMALCLNKVPIRDDTDIPFSHVPYNFYCRSEAMSIKEGNMTLALVEKFNCRPKLRVSLWSLMNDKDYSRFMFGHILSWLVDASGSVFAFTLGRLQVLRRVRRHGLESLTQEQGEIAKKFLKERGGVSYGRGYTVWTASRALGFDAFQRGFQFADHFLERLETDDDSDDD